MALCTIHCNDESLLNGFKLGALFVSSRSIYVVEHSKIIVDGKEQHILVIQNNIFMPDMEYVLTDIGLEPKKS